MAAPGSDPRPQLLMPAPLPALIQEALERRFLVHRLYEAQDRDAALAQAADVRVIATGVPILTQDVQAPIDAAMMDLLPKLELIANLGVGYDNIDAAAAAARGIVVTHTPDVLTEETADTAFGLLLNAVRQLPRAERFLRAGRWLHGQFELSASLRIVGNHMSHCLPEHGAVVHHTQVAEFMHHHVVDDVKFEMD